MVEDLEVKVSGFMSTCKRRGDCALRALQEHPWITVFVMLAAIKIVLLFMGRGPLVQEHFRIGSEGTASWRYVFFSLLMGGSMLTPLWKRSKSRMDSALKGWLVFFAIAISFLIPQLLDQNYIYTGIHGDLSFWDIRHYLVMNIFFQAPYFILHLAAYVISWFVSRKKGDDRIFILTYAVSLSLICYSLLADNNCVLFRKDLWLLAVFLLLGLGQVFLKFGGLKPNRFQWYLLLGAVFGYVLYLDSFRWLSMAFHLSYLMLGVGFAWVLNKALFGGRSATELLCIFWAYIYFVAINHGYPAAANIDKIYRLGLLAGRYFSEDLVFVLLAFLCFRRWKVLGLALFGFVSVVYLAASYFDLNYFIETGHRFSVYMLEMSGGSRLAVKMVSEYLSPRFFLIFIGLAVLALSGPIWAFSKSETMDKRGGVVRCWLLISLFFSLAGGFLCPPDTFVGAPIRNVISDSKFIRSLRSPMISKTELVKGFEAVGARFNVISGEELAREGKPKNLVLVILESMPNIHLSLFNGEDETQPMMKKYLDRMERYPNVFCSWPSSNHARTTIWSGLYPIRSFLSVANPQIKRKSLTEILEDAGYFNAFFYSSDKNYTRLNDYLGHRGFHRIEDATSMGRGLAEDQFVSWGVREDVTLDAMKHFLDERVTIDKPFSMVYIPACPHMPYDTVDERFDHFQDGFNTLDGNFTGAYKNELLYMDWILSSLIQHLDETGLSENTVVMMVNDHGEQVNAKNGGVGHGWSTDPSLANIPVMVLSPELKKGKVNLTIGSQVDVLPTLLDYLNLAPPSNMPMQGQSIRSGVVGSRKIFLGSYSDYAVIEGHSYYRVPAGKLKDFEYFNISNRGPRTIFDKQTVALPAKKQAELEAAHTRFVKLQESLIKHYGEYEW
jgi:glucan phosphoethanolaminetransferase (alkaline phosphatase superfamily)